MEELVITPSTVVLLLVIAACVVLAVRRLLRRGMCDCGDHCESAGCSHCAKECRSGAECSAVQDMLAKMETVQIEKTNSKASKVADTAMSTKAANATRSSRLRDHNVVKAIRLRRP